MTHSRRPFQMPHRFKGAWVKAIIIDATAAFQAHSQWSENRILKIDRAKTNHLQTSRCRGGIG